MFADRLTEVAAEGHPPNSGTDSRRLRSDTIIALCISHPWPPDAFYAGLPLRPRFNLLLELVPSQSPALVRAISDLRELTVADGRLE